MKKLLITLISIFVFINIAFAQSAIDKKVDSLKNEQAKAEQAKKAADDRLRNDLTDKNYQAAKTAREKMEKVNKELEVALSEQKAEQEAKAKAAAAAERERLEALYKNKFPVFDMFGISGEIKEYIISELGKNPNWDIINIEGDRYNIKVDEGNNPSDFAVETIAYTIIESTSGTKKFKGYNKSFVEAYNDPSKAYEFKQKQMWTKGFKDFYYIYTGQKISEELRCDKIELYRVDIPNNGKYYQARYTTERYKDINRFDAYDTTYYLKKVKQGTYFYFTCDGKRYGEKPIFTIDISRMERNENNEYIIKVNWTGSPVSYDAEVDAFIYRCRNSHKAKLAPSKRINLTDEFIGLTLMQKDVEDQYYKSTGKKYDFSKIANLKCEAVAMSYKDIPADSCYYRKENKSDGYLNIFNKIKGNRIVFAICINGKEQQDLLGNVYTYESAFGANCQDKLIAQKDTIKQLSKTYFLPLNQIKTFMLKDYMAK